MPLQMDTTLYLPCPPHRTRNWVVSGTLGVIGTEKSAESCDPAPYFLTDSSKIELSHRDSKERPNWLLCRWFCSEETDFTAQSAENQEMQLPAS